MARGTPADKLIQFERSRAHWCHRPPHGQCRSDEHRPRQILRSWPLESSYSGSLGIHRIDWAEEVQTSYPGVAHYLATFGIAGAAMVDRDWADAVGGEFFASLFSGMS